jgi:hypothetical protein
VDAPVTGGRAVVTRIFVGLFLVAHGLVHLLYLVPAPEGDPSYPFVPESRWIADALSLAPGMAKAFAGTLAVASALAFALAGVALIVDVQLWRTAAAVGAVGSLALMALFFHPWLSIGIAIDLAILADITWWHVPTAAF